MSTEILEVSVGSRNSAPSRTGCAVNVQTTKATNEYLPPFETSSTFVTKEGAIARDHWLRTA